MVKKILNIEKLQPDSAIEDWENQLAELIDWSHPDLADVSVPACPSSAREREAQPRQRLRAVIARIRRHDHNYFGFSAGFLDALRKSASTDDLARARQRMDAALQGDLLFPPHSNAFAALGEETLHLALDAPRAAAIAQRVRERQPDWSRNVWTFGITRGAVELLRCLSVHRSARDDDLIPVLGWLCAIAPIEWESARQWSERLLGCSGHNWWIHSLFGFWMAGVLFPHFKGFQRFAALAPTYLEREVHLLFAEDGWSKEGAAGYHCWAAVNAVAFARLAQRHGITFSSAFQTKLRAIADASWKMLGPDGHPTFGDDGPPSKPGLTFRCLAARFNLSRAKGALELLESGADAQLDFLPDNGDDLTRAFQQMPSEPPPRDTALPHSGLYAMRSDWTPTGDWMAINAMPLGEVVTSHKHADIFNIEVCVRGRRVMVDNWYGDITLNDGQYKSAPEILNEPMKRRWRVGSSAHNVATINNEDQVPVVEIYRYGWHERPLVEEFVSEARYCFFSGAHEAWRRLAQPVTAHRRSIFYLRGEYWIVIDRFTVETEAARSFQQHFQLLKGAEVLPGSPRPKLGIEAGGPRPKLGIEAGGQIRTHGQGGNLLLASVTGLTGKLSLEPNPHPISSYQNPDHALIETSAAGDVVMAVLLVPFADDAVPSVAVECVPVECGERTLSAWEATALSINLNGRTDFFFQQHMHWNLPWRSGGYVGDGRLFHSCLPSASHGLPSLPS